MSAEHGMLIVLSGPSGAGKDTVMNRVLEERTDFKRIVTTTSRAPREGEINGIDYNFVSREEFEQMITDNKFLEFVLYGDDYKGTPKTDVENILNGENAIWRIDMERAATVREFFKEKFPGETGQKIIARTIVLLIGVSHLDVLRDRSKSRDPNFDRKEFVKRLRKDWSFWHESNFQNVIINQDDKQEDAVRQVMELISTYEE